MAAPFDRVWTRQPQVVTGLSPTGLTKLPVVFWSAVDGRNTVNGNRPTYGSGITYGPVAGENSLSFTGAQSNADNWFGTNLSWNNQTSFWILSSCVIPTGASEYVSPLLAWSGGGASVDQFWFYAAADGSISLTLRGGVGYSTYTSAKGAAPSGKRVVIAAKWTTGTPAVIYCNGVPFTTTRTGTLGSDSFNIENGFSSGLLQINTSGGKGSVSFVAAGITIPSNLQQLSANPWQLFAPLRRPIFPGFAAGGGVNLTPGNTSIAVASFAPTLAQTTNSALTPGAATIAVSAFAPTIARTANVALTPGVTTLSIAAFAPASAQTANIALTPGVVGLTVATFAPTMAQSSASTFTPAAAALSLAAFAPTLAQTSNSSLIPSAAALTISTFAPTLTVGAGINLTPGQAALTLASFAPTIAQSANVALTPAAAAITVQTYAPNLAQSGALNLTPGTAALVLQIFVPSLVQSSDEVFAAITSGRMLRSAPSGGRAPQVSTSRRPS